MQSGIKASADLHEAFAEFTSTPSHFALPVTITSEHLQPLDPIPFSSADSSLSSNLPTLEAHVQPKIPIYLLLRTEAGSNVLTAVTYIPSTAPVRSKTLFASTRATLVRELGIEKFGDTIFCTDAEEVLDPKQWAERKSAQEGQVNTDLLSTEERELQGVRRAEEEERFGTKGRDLMGAGGSGIGSATAGVGVEQVQAGNRLMMKITDEAKSALGGLSRGEGGETVVLGIDTSTETITLISSSTISVPPSELSSKIPAEQPSYTFYHFPSTPSILFIYVCPSSSKIKARMIAASSRAFVPLIAQGEGVEVSKRLEFGAPEEVTESRLREEVDPKTEETSSRTAFARPKRPGRR